MFLGHHELGYIGTHPTKPLLVSTARNEVACEEVNVIVPTDPRTAVEVEVTCGKNEAN